MYFIYGSRDVLEAQCKNLHKRVELELDGHKIQLPELEGIVILNINSWCGGCEIWKNNNGSNGTIEPPSRYRLLLLLLLTPRLSKELFCKRVSF